MIALGSDHAGYELKLEIIKYLDEKGLKYKDTEPSAAQVLTTPFMESLLRAQ
jgi:ribose 5-phosphate isomerase RpiB